MLRVNTSPPHFYLLDMTFMEALLYTGLLPETFPSLGKTGEGREGVVRF